MQDIIGFPNSVPSGQRYNIGEKPAVILYTFIIAISSTLRACINDVPKIKIGKSKIINQSLI